MENKSFKLRFLELQNEVKVSKDVRNKYADFDYRTKPQILETIKPIALKYGIIITTTSELVEVGTKVVDFDGKLINETKNEGGRVLNQTYQGLQHAIVSRVFVNSTAIATDIYSDQSIKAQAQAELQEKRGTKMSEPQLTGSSDSYAGKYALGNLLGLDDNSDPDSANNTVKVVENNVATTQTTVDDNVVKVQKLRQELVLMEVKEFTLDKVKELTEIVKIDVEGTAFNMLLGKAKANGLKYDENTKEWGK